MTTPNFADKTIWTGDNLNILRGMNSECVDLIYLDRENAQKYNRAIALWRGQGYRIRCQARLAGGGRKHIGAWLDLNTPQVIEDTFNNPSTRK